MMRMLALENVHLLCPYIPEEADAESYYETWKLLL
jgi:hypothetical protein